MTRKAIVTGAAGFVGSNLVDHLLEKNWKVTGLDNLITGQKRFLKKARQNSKFEFIEVDLYTSNKIGEILEGNETVFHLAANADVRFGPDHPSRDLEQNVLVTHRILEAMRQVNVKNIVFSSTGSVYGEAGIVPTPENAPFPIQNSLYGASKLACEALIEAYCESFGMKSWIFRFVSILGPRYSHGHVYDFIKQLRADSSKLKILGNGHQNKSYLHVEDCILGIELALESFKDPVNVINLGNFGTCSVRDSLKWIIEELNVNPVISYGIEDRGWIGDSPLIHLATDKISSTSWSPKWNIESSVRDTVKYLQSNDWLFSDEN
jgi:UDP-glucose 4-epimerase